MKATREEIKQRNEAILRKVEANMETWPQWKRDCAVDFFFSYRSPLEYTNQDVQDFRALWRASI